MPRNDPVQFPLPILTAFSVRPLCVSRSVLVQPLFSEYRKESREEEGGEAGVQQTLDVGDCLWRTVPSWQSGNVTTECGVVDLINQDTKEGGSLLARIRLKLGLDLGDERGSYNGEQTGLSCMSEFAPPSRRIQTHEYQGRIQVFTMSLHKCFIVSFCLHTVVVIKLGAVILLRRVPGFLGAAGVISVQRKRDVRFDFTHQPAVCSPLHA